MTEEQIRLIRGLLAASFLLLAVPLLWKCGKNVYYLLFPKKRRTFRSVKTIVVFSGLLLLSIWCLRYAVGYYAVWMPFPDEVPLSPLEEIFNSAVHALQTFSMDEDYTKYIHNGRTMMETLCGEDSVWIDIYGGYAAVLNFIAPIAGGAIIFEVIASIFPRLWLMVVCLIPLRNKYYFSKLNENSLALLKSMCEEKHSQFIRPISIFSDAYADEGDEKRTELLQSARRLGAICVKDDLSHIRKSRLGKRTFFLIAEEPADNLRAFACLADEDNYRCLKEAEVYLFCEDDAYAPIEEQIIDRLKTAHGFTREQLPTVIPIRSYWNLVTNLLQDIPLYEPLMERRKNTQGAQELTVTILGTGSIGTEMFLTTYWIGQMLNTRLTVNVVTQDSVEQFWGKIDCINPEIRRTTVVGDPILRYNSRGDFSDPYCTVNVLSCDVRSSTFIRYMTGKETAPDLVGSDYVMVALGSDEDNLAVANTVYKYIGQQHITALEDKRTVIAYVIYDTGLCRALNGKQLHHSVSPERADIYMQAIGCLEDVYSARNVFMNEYDEETTRADEAFLSRQSRERRSKESSKRRENSYYHWASRARTMHKKYKAFSLGMLDVSLFTLPAVEQASYADKVAQEMETYQQYVSKVYSPKGEEEQVNRERQLHLLSWLEHRRWCAFTRVMGYRQTADYEKYHALEDSHKHVRLRLHPCLVECDRQGIRASLNPNGSVDTATLFGGKELDCLDEVSYRMHELGYGTTDFKINDYPGDLNELADPEKEGERKKRKKRKSM